MSLFDSSNAAYVQALYEEYARNPDSVPPEWRSFFEQGTDSAVDAGLIVPEALTNGGGAPAVAAEVGNEEIGAATEAAAAAVADAEHLRRLFPVVARATAYLLAFRARAPALENRPAR